ncbi:MAG: NUDIX domain-containing protein [Pseudomonadales bacterium]|nr:NUDIX domain-containing protein [Pseudomonadales bacterium]
MAARAPHQLTEDVKLLQKVVIVHKGKVLLLQRDPDSATRPEKWDLPGGNSEWPAEEKLGSRGLHQEDVAREIKEETGITVLPGHFTLDKMVYFDTTFFNDVFTVLTGWMVELPHDFDTDLVVLSEEHTTYEWAEFDDAREYDFDFAKEFIVPMIRTTQDSFSD